MFKYILSVSLAVSFASAATISTSATCNGVTTIGTFFASCNDREAFASITAPSFVDTRIGLSPDFSVSADVNTVGFDRGGASATFSDDYVFTVYGGTGAGSFCPVIDTSHGSGASAGMAFAGIDTGDCFSITGRECVGEGARCVPFTFGVPQIISIVMSAQASGVGSLSGGASASLQSSSPIMFFDAAGNPLLNATFTLVEVPEPTALSLLGVGLMFFLAVEIRGMRFRGRFRLHR